MDPSPLRAKILETIVRKSSLKQQVFDNTFATFNELKDILFEMSSEWDDELDGRIDRRVRIEPYVPADDDRLARRYRDVLAAGPLLLSGGEELSYADRKGGFWGRHPRSLVGVTQRGEVVMIVVDGRFPKQAAGMTIGELAYLAVGTAFGAEPRRRRFVDALVRGGGRCQLSVGQPAVRPRRRTACHELHRSRGEVAPFFEIDFRAEATQLLRLLFHTALRFCLRDPFCRRV